MGYRSNVAVAVDEESKNNLLKICTEIDLMPDKVLNVGNDVYILYWEYLKWYVDIDDNVTKIHNAILTLKTYEYIIVGEDGATEHFYSDDAPYILGTPLCYYKDEKWNTI